MNKTSILALTLVAFGLVPVACTIESSTKDGNGGADNEGGADNAGGAKSSGGSGAKGGTTATGGKIGTGGSSAVAGAKSTGGASNVAGATGVAGSTTSAGTTGVAGATTGAGATGVAGSLGVAGGVNVAGSTGLAGATGLAGTNGLGGAAGSSAVPGVAGAAGATGLTCPTTRTRKDVTDNITAPTIWTADKVYVIQPGDTLYVGATLTIEPCTVVKVGSNATINIQAAGQLNAVGTAAAHIVFTGLKDDSAGGDTNGDGSASQPTIGDWEKLSLNANSSSLNYVEFRYADAGLEVYGSNQSVKNSVFTYNNYAIDASTVAAPASSAVITNNLFYGNVHPLVINGGTAIDATNVFHNPAAPNEKNTFQSIDVVPNISNAVTWSNTEVAYALTEDSGTYNVNSPATLTLAAGVVVKVAPGANMTVHTGATLGGFAGAIFTSYKDDSKLGDSNGDGAASTPVAEEWEGVRVITSNSDTWLSGDNLLYGVEH